MLKRTIFLMGLVVLLAAVSSCIFDAPEKPPGEVPPPDTQKIIPLTTKEAVLNNIEVSYRKRRLDKYDELLDLGFTFFLSTGDVGEGLPVSWGRADEILANTYLFDPTQTQFPTCKSIKMDVKWEEGLAWVEIIPASAPTETWYTTTVFYNFEFDVLPDTQYINNPGAKAQFTVRNAGTVDEPLWKLVEFRDLGDK